MEDSSGISTAFSPLPSPKPLVIAVDGPAASGKGTLARRLASHLGLAHLDTGRLYRAVALKLIQEGSDGSNVGGALEIARNLTLADINSPALQTEEVGRTASQIAAIGEVRKALFHFQRDFAASKTGAVLDGRDIGTVICPDAHIKFFITASVESRAERRFKELQSKGFAVIYENIVKDLQERDARDRNRTVAPLAIANDAIKLDTSLLDADEVFLYAFSQVEAFLEAKNAEKSR